MGSYGGHVLPGTFFLIFGVWYTLRYAYGYLRCKSPGRSRVFNICRVPCCGIVIEGLVKVLFVSIGILVELFYVGTSPSGHLHKPNGEFTNPMNWQHATMYFFFGMSGVADVASHLARHVVPLGLDRIFGGLALFIEGYLFYFHLHGRSHIDTRVHILLVLAVWPAALFAFVQCLVMRNRKILHIFEMLSSTLLVVQGLWFWQVAYILYPPHGEPWDPCHRPSMPTNSTSGHTQHGHMPHGHDSAPEGCNTLPEAELNLMFITLFWTWHVAGALSYVALQYLLLYKFLKWRGLLDPSFKGGYEAPGNSMKYHSVTPHANGVSLLANVDEEDDGL